MAERLVRINDITNVANGQRFTARLPLGVCYEKLFMQLGGTFTKAQLTDLELKLNSKVLHKFTGTELDTINAYKGLPSTAAILPIDLTERDGKDTVAQLLGTINATGEAGVQALTLEGDITGATNPTIALWAEVSVPSTDPLVLATKRQVISVAGATEQSINIPRGNTGGQVRRIYVAGANVTALRFARESVQFFETIPVALLSYHQQMNRKVPQSGYNVFDFVSDNLYLTRAMNTAQIALPKGGFRPVEDLDVRVVTSGASTLTVLTEYITRNDNF